MMVCEPLLFWEGGTKKRKDPPVKFLYIGRSQNQSFNQSVIQSIYQSIKLHTPFFSCTCTDKTYSVKRGLSLLADVAQLGKIKAPRHWQMDGKLSHFKC